MLLEALYGLLEVLAVLVPVLLAVAFMTIIERKALAAMQRRVGPNTVGAFGVLQPLTQKASGTKIYLSNISFSGSQDYMLENT